MRSYCLVWNRNPRFSADEGLIYRPHPFPSVTAKEKEHENPQAQDHNHWVVALHGT
jgi:hypothetical protein